LAKEIGSKAARKMLVVSISPTFYISEFGNFYLLTLSVQAFQFFWQKNAGTKAAGIMFIKLTIGVDFINILRSHFALIFWRQKLQSCVLGLKFFNTKISVQKLLIKC